jgi:hypothetical protein
MTERTMAREPLAMERGQTVLKDPDVSQLVSFNWRDELVRGRVDLRLVLFTASRWSVVNANYTSLDQTLRVEAPAIGSDHLSTRATLIGGIPGAKYVVTNSIVTTGGARIDRAVIVAMTPGEVQLRTFK